MEQKVFSIPTEFVKDLRNGYFTLNGVQCYIVKLERENYHFIIINSQNTEINLRKFDDKYEITPLTINHENNQIKIFTEIIKNRGDFTKEQLGDQIFLVDKNNPNNVYLAIQELQQSYICIDSSSEELKNAKEAEKMKKLEEGYFIVPNNNLDDTTLLEQSNTLVLPESHQKDH